MDGDGREKYVLRLNVNGGNVPSKLACLAQVYTVWNLATVLGPLTPSESLIRDVCRTSLIGLKIMHS